MNRKLKEYYPWYFGMVAVWFIIFLTRVWEMNIIYISIIPITIITHLLIIFEIEKQSKEDDENPGGIV